MKAGARPVRMLLVGSLALVAVLAFSALGIRRLHSDETTGLEYLALTPPMNRPPPPVPSQEESTAYWMASELAELNEPAIDKVAGNPAAEVYRFFYAPTFDPRVCVTIWQEENVYHLRTRVMGVRPTFTLWGKTETISARKWNRLRAAFTKRSVTDPFDGNNFGGGIDGSSWYLQSFVSGRVTTTQVGSPVNTLGPAHFQIITARDSRARDFVKTSLLFLDWAGVHVPEIY